MLITALVFFACAALLGLFLLSFVLTNKETPKGVALVHGFFAVIGVVILIIYPFLYSPAPKTSLILFIVAAMGGAFLLFRDLTGKGLPKWMALGHGTLAVIAFVTLAIFIFA